MSFFTTVALLVFLAIAEGTSVGDQEVTLGCRCIAKESQPIGRLIRNVEVIPANIHCAEIEIIATLKNDGGKVCLDPAAPWVQRVLQKRNELRQQQLSQNIVNTTTSADTNNTLF